MRSSINEYEFFSTFDSNDRQATPKSKFEKKHDQFLPVNLVLGLPEPSEMTASNSKCQTQSGRRDNEGGIKMVPQNFSPSNNETEKIS